MIKTLINADEDPPPGTEVVIEERRVIPTATNEAETKSREIFEIPETAKFFSKTDEEKPSPPAFLEKDSPPIFELDIPEPAADRNAKEVAANSATDAPDDFQSSEPEIFAANENEPPQTIENIAAMPAEAETAAPEETREIIAAAPETIFQSNYAPETTADTVRKSGLAYSAAIVLFGSIVFMLVLGWFADLLLGSSPWGIVLGIVLGAIIGFIQFFRITSSIFKQNSGEE